VTAVTNSPNSYNLYTFTQYANNGATNFSAGRSDVTNLPNTYGLNTVSQLQALNVNSPLLAKNPTNGMFTLTVGVQRAPQLTNFALFPMSSPGFTTSINPAGNLEFNFTDANDAAFFRLQAQWTCKKVMCLGCFCAAAALMLELAWWRHLCIARSPHRWAIRGLSFLAVACFWAIFIVVASPRTSPKDNRLVVFPSLPTALGTAVGRVRYSFTGRKSPPRRNQCPVNPNRKELCSNWC